MAQTMAIAPATRFFNGFGATIRVHPDHIGFICGKRFATLSEIGRATHTRVVVTNGDGNLKVITIGGRSVADVTAAYERLMQVAREAEARTPRVAGWSPAMTALNIVPLQGIEHRVVIQKEDVGMVLGAKGSTAEAGKRYVDVGEVLQGDGYHCADVLDPWVSPRGCGEGVYQDAFDRTGVVQPAYWWCAAP